MISVKVRLQDTRTFKFNVDDEEAAKKVMVSINAAIDARKPLCLTTRNGQITIPHGEITSAIWVRPDVEPAE